MNRPRLTVSGNCYSVTCLSAVAAADQFNAAVAAGEACAVWVDGVPACAHGRDIEADPHARTVFGELLAAELDAMGAPPAEADRAES